MPEDFSFKHCEPDDIECFEQRTTFMKQWEHYQNNKARTKPNSISVTGRVSLVVQGIVLDIQADPHKYSIMTDYQDGITNINIVSKR